MHTYKGKTLRTYMHTPLKLDVHCPVSVLRSFLHCKMRSAEILYVLRFNILWKNRMKQSVYKLISYQNFTFTMIQSQCKPRISWSKKINMTKFPHSEISIRQEIRSAKFSTVKFPKSKIPAANFLSAVLQMQVWTYDITLIILTYALWAMEQIVFIS